MPVDDLKKSGRGPGVHLIVGLLVCLCRDGIGVESTGEGRGRGHPLFFVPLSVCFVYVL